MKSMLFLLTLLMGLVPAARAQMNVAFGVKAGGTLSTLSGKQATNYKSHFGYHAGGFATIAFSDLFAFQPEVLYSQKGAELTTIDLTTKVNYMDVPLLLRVSAGEAFFEGGPQIGLLLRAKDQSETYSRTVTGLYKGLDLGYAFGLGYQLKNGPGAGLRYNGGLTRVEKLLSPYSAANQNDIRNSAFQVYLSYGFTRQ